MSIELLAPAGNYEKLETALAYGADAAYMGLTKFSLRKNATNFTDEELDKVWELKRRTGKKLYCTMNILFSEDNIREARELVPTLKDSPFDAFLISDMGLVEMLRKYCPDKQLHLSTQASCINSASAKFYHDIGFSRVVLGRECSLDDIKRIKDAVPELELEAFVHGAMCMSYSGRCLLSAHLTGRSGNKGDCSHTCRWNYRLGIEEEERPGRWFPIEESEDGYTTILSSKDLCMIDHVDDLVDAGLSSLKIEGRMKSLYYVAVVTRAYRKALDHDPEALKYREDLFNVSHREFSTAFFYSKNAIDTEDDINRPTSYGYQREYMYLGTLKEEVRPGIWSVDVRNQIRKGKQVEFIGPDVFALADDSFALLDADLAPVEKLDHGKIGYIQTDKAVRSGYILRSESEIKTLN